MKKILALMLALSATPASACWMEPSWDLGEMAITLRASPGGAWIASIPPTNVVVLDTAYPWVFVTTPYGDGWTWLQLVPAGCLPPPPASCCVTAPQPVEPPYHAPAPRYHEKGQYQDAPPPPYHEKGQLPEAPMPEYGPKGNM